MDSFLDCLGLFRSDVAKDSSCLFRAVSEHLFYTQAHHVKIKEDCYEFMERNRKIFEPLVKQDFEEYLDKTKEKEWAGEVEMKALSMKYKIDFTVYYEINKSPLKIKASSSTQTVTLACTGGNLYDCVYTKSELSALAFCQSVIYEILYKEVFDLGSDVDVAVDRMLHDKAYTRQRRNNFLCHYFKECCCIDGMVDKPILPEDDLAGKSPQDPRLEIRKALAQGVPPFPYKVAKTLDPGIYRNVEFDMWNERQKEDQKSEPFVIPKLQPGVKCKVHLNKDTYVGHVQDVSDDSESVSVYVEELCERCIVSSNVLEIFPVPAYKALTWQGGKTYRVYADCSFQGTDNETNKQKKNRRNFQDPSSCYKDVSNTLKPKDIARSNSMPASVAYRNGSGRKSNAHSSPRQHRRKGHSVSCVPPPRPPAAPPQGSHLTHQAQCCPQTFPCIWNGISPNLSTSPIPISCDVSDCCTANSVSPGFNDSDEPPPDPGARYSPPPSYAAGPYGVPGALPPPTLPLPVPGSQQQLPEEQQQSPLAVYHPPCPVYTVPGMYIVCRDRPLHVNFGAPWGPQEGGPGDVQPGLPSVYFNTPPGGGVSPPMACFVPAGGGGGWGPAVPSVAFTPPLDMGAAYHPALSPPWSPQQFAPPHCQVHPGATAPLQQEPALN